MSDLSQYYDFTKMYDGQYTIVSINSNSLVLRPTKAPNQVIYPEYLGGAEIEHSTEEIEFEFATQMPRIRQVPLGIKFKDDDISLKAIINGNTLDLSDKLTCEGSVDYEHEGIYKLTYKINYLGYELEYVKLIAVSRVEWLKYLVPECFRDEGSITKEIINRLEQMYWSFSNQFDATRYILSDTKIACPSFEEHPELAGYIFDTTNKYLFATLNLASGHKFKLEASEDAKSYLCINQIIAKEFNLGSSYIEGDITRYSSKTYRRNAEEDDNLYPGESRCWDVGYLIHTNADAEIKAAISSNQIIYRDDYKVEYAGYIYEFNSENLKLNNNDILDIISIQKNNYAYLTPPRCIGVWSNAIEKLAIENDLVIAFDEEFKAHNLIRNNIKYSKQAVAPYDEDNELWLKSKIWKLSEHYHGQEAYAKRVNNLTEFEIKNYALELGISESLLEVIHKYNKDDISILYAIQFVVKYHHTIPGFLFLVRLIGLKIEHLRKSNPEEIIRIDGNEISDIQDQLNALSSIDLANSAGLYDSTKTYNPGDIVFDDNNIYEIGDNGQPLPIPKWSYEYRTDAKDCNNAFYEVDVSTKNYASDDCNKDIVNLGDSESTTYIDDDGLKYDILSNLKIVQNYSIPAYIIVRMKLHFYSQMKLSRWSIGHATYHFDSYHGIPPFCIMFDSMAVVSLGGSVYQPLLEVVKAKIYVADMGSQAFWTEAYPRQVMRIPVDENGRSKFRLKIELPAGYSLKKWRVQGLGDVEHFDSHNSIDNTSNLTNFVAEAVKGDSLVTALIYARFQLILYLHEQDGWTPRTGTYEMYVQGENVQDMIDAIESIKIYYGDDPENLQTVWASNVRHEGNFCIFRGYNLENVRYLVAYPHCTGAGFELFKFTPADKFDTTNLINSEMKFQIFEGSEGETYRIIGRVDGVDHLVVDSNNNNLVGFMPTEE